MFGIDDVLIGAAITGGSGMLSSIFGASQSGANTAAQIQASQAQQATQNAFTERMSSTAYQRASTDMKAAGLNPMMMFGQGGPASTPSGSSIQAPMPQTKSPMEGMGQAAQQAVSSAVAIKTMDKMTSEISNLKTQNDVLLADKAKKEAETTTERERPGLVRQQTATEREDTGRTKALRQAAEYDVSGHAVADVQNRDIAEMMIRHPEWSSRLTQADWSGGKIGGAFRPVTDFIGSATQLGRLKASFDLVKENARRTNQVEHTLTKPVRGGGYSSERWRN